MSVKFRIANPIDTDAGIIEWQLCLDEDGDLRLEARVPNGEWDLQGALGPDGALHTYAPIGEIIKAGFPGIKRME